MTSSFHDYPQSFIVLDAPYLNWIDTAVCVTESVYSHRGFELQLCSECARILFPRDWEEFQVIHRHYIHIGYRACITECTECDVILNTTSPVQDCYRCHLSIALFVQYLEETDDDPYNDSGPTILEVIEPTEGPPPAYL